jgi:uncharacterized membrane protein YuzA (DUF378 family)
MKGLYHVALFVVAVTAFNYGFLQLTNVNIVNRLFQEVSVPDNVLAFTICAPAILVIWHNWID